jgi:hypothetical protein
MMLGRSRFARFSLRFVVPGALLLTSASFGHHALAQAQMSETEKKAAARSAYQEGVQLQDSGRHAEALARFEAAQKLYDAPTHQLHIAQCQAKTGRLVEASETYEALTRRALAPDAPEAFRQAQEQARQELPELRPRIPTLRVVVKPDPSTIKDLRVTVNGTQMPAELIGIARPINPGTYRVTAQAQGWNAQGPGDTSLAEKESKSVEITMVQGGGVAPIPPVYTGNNPQPQPQPKEEPQPQPKEEGSSSLGMLVGVRGGAFVPSGSLGKNEQTGNEVSMDKYATAGGGFGIDAYLRVARLLLLGGTFEYASLGTPSQIEGVAPNLTVTATNNTTYFGLAIGVIPNIDRVSFIGEAGLGRRQILAAPRSEPSRERRRKPELGPIRQRSRVQPRRGRLDPSSQYLRIVPKASLNFARSRASV